MDAAARHKRQVRLIVPGEAEAVEDVNDFARVYYIPARYSPIFDKRYRLILPWQYMPSETHIRKILIDEMPDIVEVTDKYTLSMLGAMIRIGKFKQLGRPMLVHFSCERMDDNIGAFMSKGQIGKWLARRVMGNYILPSFDFHIANSTYTAEEFYLSARSSENPRRSKWLFNKCWRFFQAPRVEIAERIFVCPRGVDAERFTPERRSETVRADMRKRAGIPPDSTILLYAGRLSPEKNVVLLPEMMKALASDPRDIRLLIAGAGPQAEWLKEQGSLQAPGKIILLGHLDKELLADYYANADIFVHPNPREPFGIAPLEAMASGVPTVAPRAGGILSYATDENVWLVEPKAENFAAAILDILSDNAARNKKVAAALETARANTRIHSTDRLFAAYDKMYEDFTRRNDLYTKPDTSGSFDYAGIV